METTELLKKVRKIEIKTKGLSNQVFAGSYHSAFKGRGMSFSEVRNYNYGDDVRNIDWNVTARFDAPFVKVFEEEREVTVMLLVDVSKSSLFGTQNQFKNEIIAEIAAVLSFSAVQNNDKVGVLFFSNKIEKFLPPKKGKSHILRIIRELINIEASEDGTDLSLALEYFNNLVKRRSIAFVISDFVSKPYEDALKIVKKKHDIVGVHLYDKLEKELPDIGLVQVRDSETQALKWIDTSSKALRKNYSAYFEKKREENQKIFNKINAEFVSLSTEDNYTTALLKMFKHRGKKR
ncbi:MAG: DUF58 domain-containing protein [Chitinophagales bacterium]|nr:DUF58 domain-containing protein [Chitinophagales bacterium]